MFRKTLSAIALLAAFVCTSASAIAQEKEGLYESTHMNGAPIAPGFQLFIDVEYSHTDMFGDDHYVTRSFWWDIAQETVVKLGNPGALVMHAGLPFGSLTGSTGIQGTLWDLGGGVGAADYSAAGGNTRMWTRQ